MEAIQQVCGTYSVQDGDCYFGSGLHQERGVDILHHPQGCLFSDPNSTGVQTVPLVNDQWHKF